MRFMRSLRGLGLAAALAAPAAFAQEAPVAAPIMPPLSSPYAPRDASGQPVVAAGAGAIILDQASATPGTQHPVVSDGKGTGVNLLDCGPTAGLVGGGGAMPAMIGDFMGIYYLRTIPVVIYNTGTGDRDPAAPLGGLPLVSRGPFKVAENESPEPQDRVFVTYNYFKVRGNYPEINPFTESLDLQRVTVGFEKSFWNGHGSIGVRVPFFDANYVGRTRIVPNPDGSFDIGDPLMDDLEDSELGDITLLFKAAIGCCAEHKLCSFGLAVTLPTGPSIEAYNVPTGTFQDKHAGILQPFVGYLWTGNNWYVHGFFSVAFPMHTGDDVIILFSDIGFGYYLYGAPPGLKICGGGCGTCGPTGCGTAFCDPIGCCGAFSMLTGLMPSWVTSVVPTLELHLNTPLTNGGKFEYVQLGSGVLDYAVSTGSNMLMSQSLIVTGGVHFGLMGNSTLTIGAAVPLNVQPYDVAGIVQLNWRF